MDYEGKVTDHQQIRTKMPKRSNVLVDVESIPGVPGAPRAPPRATRHHTMMKNELIKLFNGFLIDKNTDTVKTIKFSNRNYVGDILNNIRIFNEKEVDEIVVLDIDISNLNYEPNYEIISKIASVCRMPLTYGGGIKNISVAKETEKIIKDLTKEKKE